MSVSNNSDEKLKELVDLCHILFCTRLHDKKIENLSSRHENNCYYELEETLDSCWDCADHMRMLKFTVGTIDLFGLEDADKALDFFKEVIELCQQLNELISEHPESSGFVKGMIG